MPFRCRRGVTRWCCILRRATEIGHRLPLSDLQTKVAHIFNVFCNGKVLLENFDLAKEARESDVVVRKAFGLEPNAQGKLLLSFVPVQGYASVTGIEVLPQ